MKLSLVIPYHNRKALLYNVLKSIEPNMNSNVEIIIVDDGSDKDNEVDFSFINYTLIRLKRGSEWRMPCVAYNTGFKAATGDVIMLNSSECIHMGDVIGYVFKHFKEDNYFSFSTYMMNKDENLGNLRFDNFWGVHSSVGNSIPYCGVISTKNMNILGGYDERFANGIGFDDYDFTHRVHNLGLNIQVIDNPFIVHQWHNPTVYPNYKNLDLLNLLNKEFPNRIKAENKL